MSSPEETLGVGWESCTENIKVSPARNHRYAFMRCWHDATRESKFTPNHNGPVWIFCPDIGNDDDGYGYVMIGLCTQDSFGSSWVDCYGNSIQPVLWTEIVGQPQRPYVYNQKPPSNIKHPKLSAELPQLSADGEPVVIKPVPWMPSVSRQIGYCAKCGQPAFLPAGENECGICRTGGIAF